MKKTSIVLSIACLCAVLSVFSQESERYLEIRGRAELDMQPLNGATATLYEGNTVAKTARTGSDGMFSFKLEMNKYYVVEVGKTNYISKRLAFDTSLPDEETGVWVREFAISVVKNCEGVDYSALKDPVDVIKFNTKSKDFDSDRAYLSRMRSKLENIMIANENCVSDKYNQMIKEADRLYDQKSYEEAKEKYAAASELFQNEEYPRNKLNEISQLQAKQENIDALYNKTIGEAEALMAQNKPEEALLKYKGAMTLKPQESLPRQKAGEIETLLAKNQAAQQTAAAQEAQYNNALARANTEMVNKNYEGAKQLYQSALQLKPGDQSVAAKIAQLDNLIAEQSKNLANQKATDEAYKTAIAQAEQQYAAKNYEGAKEFYQKAAAIKPGDPYPANKMTEIDRISQEEKLSAERARAAETEKQYQAALVQADNLFKNKDYQGAIEAYNRALSMKPNELYPKQRISQINNTVAAEEARKQRETDAGYQTALAAAEKSFAAKDYPAAKGYYQQALQFKPDDEALKSKIAEMERLTAEEAQKKQQQEETGKRYLAAVQKADQLFAAKNLDAAKSAYQEAQSIKPDEPYPLQRIQEIDRQRLAEQSKKQQQIMEGYQNAVNAGNAMLAQKQYPSARESFQKALTFKPDDVFAKNRLVEIDNLIRQEQEQQAAIQARRTEYNTVIAKADGLFASKDYISAKSEYQRALQVLPEEQYPGQRIQEIDRLLMAEQSKKQQQIMEGYQNAVNAGNAMLAQKQYPSARESFQKALTFKPDDVFAKNRLVEIDNLIRQEQARVAAEQAKQKQYDEFIARADGLYNSKSYTDAKAEYLKALQVMPDQTYPGQKIAEIDRIVAEQQRLMAEQQAKDNAYTVSISRANDLFSKKQYELAKSEFNNALSIKPTEVYPKNRIAEIENLMLQQQQAQTRDENYKNAIAEADRLFGEKNYASAKSSYSRALGIKPNEAYPKTQISKIDNLVAETEKLKQQELARQQQYDSYISQADKLFAANNYPQSKELYQKALDLKPDEEYPRARIARIDELYALVAEQQKKQSNVSATSTQKPASSSKKIVPAELIFKNDNERDLYLASLRKEYPEGVTAEVYKEQYKVTTRYVIIRGNEVKEFREIHYLTYGGKQHSMNGKPITQMYFESQVKPREGEYYKKFEY
jgi:tetratricopeptide (TPR) repeat protein